MQEEIFTLPFCSQSCYSRPTTLFRETCGGPRPIAACGTRGDAGHPQSTASDRFALPPCRSVRVGKESARALFIRWAHSKTAGGAEFALLEGVGEKVRRGVGKRLLWLHTLRARVPVSVILTRNHLQQLFRVFL